MEAAKIIQYLKDVCAIPRASTDEKAMAEYLMAFAKERNLETWKDEKGNVVILKPAANYSGDETVILQGHLDMVYVKAEGSPHNYADGIKALEDEELSADSYYELSKIALIKGDKENAIQFANIAIDIDSSKVAPKIKKDPIFLPVMAKISIPFNIKPLEEQVSKLSEKELIAKEHLEEMFEITRNLSYADIKMLKKNEEGKTKKDIQQENDTQKEIE